MHHVAANAGDDQVQASLSPQEILRQSFALAAKAHHDGAFEEAEKLYRAILQVQPAHADALHGLGVLAHQVGQSDLAARLIREALARRVEPTFYSNLALVQLALDLPHEALASVLRALELRPAHAQAYNALGNVQQKLGHRDEAVASYEKAISLRDDFADAHGNLAKVLLETSDVARALEACEKALELNPSLAEAHNTLGNILRVKGEFDRALECFETALACRPNYAEAYNNKAVLLVKIERNDEALVAARCALALRPDFSAALATCGMVLFAEGKFDEAEPWFRKAIALDPSYVEAHNNLGATLMQLDRTGEAIEAYETAIAQMEQDARATSHFNLATFLVEKDNCDQAIGLFNKALAENPNFAAAQNNLGVALQNTGAPEEALKVYDKAIAIDPQYVAAYSNKLMAMQYAEHYDNDDALEVARAFGRLFDKPDRRRFEGCDGSAERKLRIGYVSGDFNGHPVGFFTAGAIPRHDREAFEVYCYYNCIKNDPLTEKFRSSADHWRDIIGKTDTEAAEMIRQDRIDILVDLAGHTNKTRVGICGLKPAPVQAHWIGFTGTIGLSSIDYLIIDPVSAPQGADRWYIESLVRLPYGRFCYTPMAPEVELGAPPSLSGKPFTFGSFNNITKLAPGVFKLWADVVNAAPGSRLLLKSRSLSEASVKASVLRAFAENGLEAARIELRAGSGYVEMLREYGDVDVALDPFPFGGATTTCDALFMGVPVITLPGDRLASRQTLAFLHYIGHGDLAAASPADYVARCAALAADPDRLRKLRGELRRDLLAAPFSDGARFTATLEAAYREMWRRYVAGEKPAPFDIPPAA
jgi:predicted O-linked N-acetylglucosamine transferase (SPINDLY family)